MKKGFLFGFVLTCFISTIAFGKTLYPNRPLPKKLLATSINFSMSNKSAVFYLPSSCSGLLNDYIEGNGLLSISVQGKIQNGQASVSIKINYSGMAKSTLELIPYAINGNINTSENRAITTEPVDVFVKGNFNLVGKRKSPNLYLGDLGYITIYPDGTVVNHVLDQMSNPDYSHPNIYCSNPAGK